MVKQQLITGILFATLSHFVCIANAWMEEPQRPDFIDRSYIKTRDGQRRASTATDVSSLEVTTSISPDGRQRHLVEGEMRCRLWQNCLVDAELGDVHEWECTFDNKRITQRLGGHTSKKIQVEGVENSCKFLELNGAESGKTVLVMSVADIQNDKIVVDLDNVIGVEKLDDTDRTDGNDGGFLRGDAKPPRIARHLSSYQGVLDTLVVRVNAADNSPTASAAQLFNDVYDDENCLKSQYGACSYDQLTIREYVPGNGVSNVPISATGVVDIYIDINAEGGDRTDIQNAANLELASLFGVDEAGDIFDLVLFCMPPGTGNWLAYAYINRWDSYYNNHWCQSLSSQMHEVGHSIGLHHSGEYGGSDANQEYGDQSDMMGYSYNSDDTPKMCFNPAKNWQLGWYDDKVIEINPSNDLSTEPTTYLLNGIVDYEQMTSGAHVVIKIGDYYIGYNKATGMNEEVQEGANQVLVNEKLGTPDSATQSKLVAKLTPGTFFDIEVTQALTLRVEYNQLINGKDAEITIAVKGETPTCQYKYDQSIEVEFTTDRYPGETYWAILDANGQVVHEVSSPSKGTATTTIPNLCPGLEYYFIVTDAYGDGICCDWGNGSFIGRLGNIELFKDAPFTDSLTIPFTIPPNEVPTDAPTKAPTLAPTKAPTVAPTKAPTVAPTKAPTVAPTKAPTVAPSKAPTDTPTKAPTDTPTKAPTEPPTMENESCFDDPNFVYRNKDGKDCDWVNHNTDRKTRIVCLRRANEEKSDQRKVYEFCKRTCEDAGIKKSC